MSRLRAMAGLLALSLPEPALGLLMAGRRRMVDGRRIDPKAQLLGAVANSLRGDGLPTVAESRAQTDAMAARLDRPRPRNVQTEEISLPGGSGPRPARLYAPEGLPLRGPSPLLFYLHGGGWVQGGLESHDGLCGALAAEAGIRVLALDYRLAPEHKFPAAAEDALAAYSSLLEENDLQIEPARLFVGGDSAGGNLAAGLLHDLAERGLPMPAGQLLIYPALDGRLQSPSMQSLREAYLLPRDRIDWYLDLYLPEGQDRTDPRFSGGLSPHLAAQPPAFIIAGGHDPLRDEAIAHAANLKAAGVEAELLEFPGQVHAFASLTKVLPQGREALTRAAQWLRGVTH